MFIQQGVPDAGGVHSDMLLAEAEIVPLKVVAKRGVREGGDG